ncbi:MAG: hypothetical protein AAF431_06885 [Pseudomonadota bacterium]
MKNIKQNSTTGLLVAGALLVANTANADQVILDDLIVDGSACIGLDCVNGESFGFDTIRLKENNLRIKAQDTSASASFPSNDWQITFNESNNGGANKFSIDDIDGGRTPFTIEAGAPSHSLYVDDGGRLGVGTNTPVVEVHVVDGDTPTVRLEQDGSSGFTPQIWDLAGNETNFFVRDVTNGSDLPFRIFPNAGSDALNIEGGTGDIGLGITAPTRELHIRDTAADSTGMILENTNASAQNVVFDIANSAGNWRFRTQNTGNFQFIDNINAQSVMQLVGAPAAADSSVEIFGNLIVNSVDQFPDYVFEPEYELETIEDHANYMWQNKHLPAVGKATTTRDGKSYVNVSDHARGVLEELEKAHIYIEQLHTRLAALEEKLEKDVE